MLTDGQVLTGAHMQLVKLNFDETAVAKIVGAGHYVVGAGANSLVDRQVQQSSNSATGTTTSTSFTDLTGTTAGPAVTVTTGTAALMWFGCQMQNSLANTALQVAYSLNGGTPDSSIDLFIDGLSVAGQAFRASVIHYHTGLTPGSNTFTLKYKVAAGTGSFYDRVLGSMPF